MMSSKRNLGNGSPLRISHLMIVSAILAILLTGAFTPFQMGGGVSDLLSPQYLVKKGIEFALLLVCFLHRSLSPKLRIVLLGLNVVFWSELAFMLAYNLFEGRMTLTSYLPVRIYWVFIESFQLLFIWGLFLTFRDLNLRAKPN